MDTDLIKQAIEAAKTHPYVLPTAILIGLFIRLFKADTRLPTIPASDRPFAAFLLGMLYAVARHYLTSTPWATSIGEGTSAAALAISAHSVVVRRLLGGKEMPLPAALLLRVLGASDPPPPPSDDPPAQAP